MTSNQLVGLIGIDWGIGARERSVGLYWTEGIPQRDCRAHQNLRSFGRKSDRRFVDLQFLEGLGVVVMSRSISVFLLALVQACASSVLASAQAAPSHTDLSQTDLSNVQRIAPPVAFVYVAAAQGSISDINAYAAAANGTLTPVSGSPFAGSGTYVAAMAANRRGLLVTDTVNIYSFSVAWNGALNEVSSIYAQQYNQYPTGGPVSLFFDRSRATLYDEDIYWDGANNNYQFFDFAGGAGALSYLGATSSVSAAWDTPLSFTGNNLDGYGATCLRGGQYIYGFSRSNSGTLTPLNISPTIPTASKGGYCPYLVATDPANDVAISLTPTLDGFTAIGPPQIAVYTADEAGDLTTNSTSANMPASAVKSVYDMKMSPAGDLLAISGTNGLQVFHFNGANPATRFTGLMTKDEVDQVFWDNANHLYAISRPAGKLYVFTVTPTNVRQAPGSPYSINAPQNIAVLPRSRFRRPDCQRVGMTAPGGKFFPGACF